MLTEVGARASESGAAPLRLRQMKRGFATVCAVTLLQTAPGFLKGAGAQEEGPSGPEPVAQASPFSEPEERPISWGRIVPNILHDQGTIWSFPVGLAKGEHVAPTLGLAFGTWALMSVDPADTPYFRRTQTFAGFNKVFTSTNTIAATLSAPAALYVVGLARHDRYAQDTALLATEAGADAELVDVALKIMTRRLRPSDIAPNGDFTHTFYKFNGTVGVNSSFPSGHAIVASSIATVIARRYHSKRWVAVAAYGLAGAINFSRITQQAHFPSDVFAGTFLGVAIGLHVSGDVREPPIQGQP